MSSRSGTDEHQHRSRFFSPDYLKLQSDVYLYRVRKFLRTLLLFNLILLYSLNGSAYTRSSLAVFNPAEEAQYHQEQSELSAKNWLVPCHPIENLISGASPLVQVSLQFFHFDFTAYLRCSERMLVSSFSQYHFFFSYILQRLGAKEIIFPFHSFW